MVDASEFDRIDFCPFEVLALDKDKAVTLTDREIRKSYRKQALKYHPDRNPNDPTARDKFERAKLASEILLNPALREKFNQLQRAREEQRARHAKSDSQRRNFVSDLERREQEYAEALRQARSDHQKKSQTKTEQQQQRAPRTELDRIIQETKESERSLSAMEAQRQKQSSLSAKQREQQTFVHLKTTKEFKQRKQVLSKALVRAMVEQVSGQGAITEVWVSSNSREALIKFAYKDSARKAVLHHSKPQNAENALLFRLEPASQDLTSKFLENGHSETDSISNVFREIKRSLGVPTSAKYFTQTAYGEPFLSLSDLERKVKQKIDSELPSNSK